MLGKLYTMSTTAPNAWLHLLAFLASHQKVGIIDLRPRSQEDDDPQWKKSALATYFHVYAKEYHYTFIEPVTESVHVPVDADGCPRAAVNRLRDGEDLVCFCASREYEGSIRQAVVALVRAFLPEVEHQELDAGRNPFRFYALSEPERAMLRHQERRCIEVLHACNPLASKLATVAGVYTPLAEEEERLLQMFHEFAQAHEGDAYAGTFDLRCKQAGLRPSDVGLLDGRIETLFHEREPAQAKANLISSLQRLLDKEDHQE